MGSTRATPELSVVVPLYNEEESVREPYGRTSAVCSGLGVTYELVLVDDGSGDGTWAAIRRLSEADAHVRGFRLSRNYGHQHALLAGLHMARGRAIISMDGDLQHPPEVIPALFEKWKEGSRVVLTKRLDRNLGSPLKRGSSKLFYRLFSYVAETSIQPGTSDFRLLDSAVLQQLLSFNFSRPFLRGAVETLGFERATVPFQVEPRFAGRSKYTLRRMIAFARQGFIAHSTVPLRLGIWLGLVTGVMALAELGYVVVQFFRGQTVPGWASVLGMTALLFAVLFFIVGILGMYLEDIHELLKKRPRFIIAETCGDASKTRE